MTMKIPEFLLFIMDDCEPLGGWDDFVGSFLLMEHCMEKAEQSQHHQLAQIVQGNKIIKRGSWHHESSPLTGQPGTWHYQWTDEA